MLTVIRMNVRDLSLKVTKVTIVVRPMEKVVYYADVAMTVCRGYLVWIMDNELLHGM